MLLAIFKTISSLAKINILLYRHIFTAIHQMRNIPIMRIKNTFAIKIANLIVIMIGLGFFGYSPLIAQAVEECTVTFAGELTKTEESTYDSRWFNTEISIGTNCGQINIKRQLDGTQLARTTIARDPFDPAETAVIGFHVNEEAHSGSFELSQFSGEPVNPSNKSYSIPAEPPPPTAVEECVEDKSGQYACVAVTLIGPEGPTQKIDNSGPGIIMNYMRMLITFLMSIAGVILLLFIIFYGFILMFSGITDQQAEAKKNIMSSVGGLVLLLSSGLILYTINPNFYTGYGNVAATDQPPAQEPPPATCGNGTKEEGEECDDGGQAGGCTDECKEEVSDCSVQKRKDECGKFLTAEQKQLARDIQAMSTLTFTVNADIPGSGSMDNIRDIANGICPKVQDYDGAGISGGCYPERTLGPSVCETDQSKVKAYVTNGKLTKSLKSLKAMGTVYSLTGTEQYYISSLFGGTHRCSEHRTMRGLDLSRINSVGVKSMAEDHPRDLCTAIIDLAKEVKPDKILVPPSMAGSNCLTSTKFRMANLQTTVLPDSGHDDHLHIVF